MRHSVMNFLMLANLSESGLSIAMVTETTENHTDEDCDDDAIVHYVLSTHNDELIMVDDSQPLSLGRTGTVTKSQLVTAHWRSHTYNVGGL